MVRFLFLLLRLLLLNEQELEGICFYFITKKSWCCPRGVSHATIYTRNNPTDYGKITTGVPTNSVVSSFVIDGTYLGVTNGQLLEKYQYGALVGTHQFPFNQSIDGQIRIFYFDNSYHIFKYGMDENKYYKANAAYQFTDSVNTDKRFYIYQFTPYQNKVLANGMTTGKNLPEDLEGNPSYGRDSYCELFKTKPTLDYPEYISHFSSNQSNIQLRGELGTNFIGDNIIGAEAGFLNGKSLIFNIKDVFQGITADGDTLSNLANGKVF